MKRRDFLRASVRATALPVLAWGPLGSLALAQNQPGFNNL